MPNAKAFLLKGLLGTGIFNASTSKQAIDTNPDALAGISFINSQGERISISDLKGKTVFINFWATWCPPCVAEMGGINALYNRLKDNPQIVFVLVDADGDLKQSQAFMQKHQYNLPLYSISSAVPEALYSGTLPTTLVVDANGKLIKKHEGIANYNTDAMVDFLLKAGRGN
ncbi:MAG: TlpA disulfide reductase family protein [Chitinophagaceae bacterium]